MGCFLKKLEKAVNMKTKKNNRKNRKIIDFFLWGHLKNKVYKTPPTDLQDLRNRIIPTVTKLLEIIRKSMRDMRVGKLTVFLQLKTGTLRKKTLIDI